MQEETMEIRLLDIFALCFKKAKQIIAFALAFAIVFGGIKFVLASKNDNYNAYLEEVNEYNAEFDAYQKQIDAVDDRIQYELSNKNSTAESIGGLYNARKGYIEEQKKLSEPSYSSPVKSTIKYAVIFAFLGCCVAGCVYCILPVLQGKVISCYSVEEDLKIRFFGAVKDKKKKCLFDKWADKMTRDEKNGEYILSEIKIAVGNDKDVLYTSTCNLNDEDKKQIGAIINDGKNQFDVCYSNESLQAFKDSQGVIFVEKLGETKMRDLKRMIALANEQGKKVYGYVVL